MTPSVKLLAPVVCGFFVLLVALVVVAAISSRRRNRRRIEALRAWAQVSEWTVTDRPGVRWSDRLPGHNRRGVSEQLERLLDMMRLPFVSVGVIPAGARRFAIATTGFWVFDNNAVALETPTAAVKVTRPREIAQYVALFERLQAEAEYGDAAHRMVSGLIAHPGVEL